MSSFARYRTLLRVALLTAILTAPGLAAAAEATDPGGRQLIEKFTLPNGLTVVVRENHSSPVVAVQAWVKAGGAIESAEKSGMSHILEHMAFKGTKRRGVGEVAREVEALGGDINAYTSFDETVYHITISGRYLGEAMDIISDTLANSVFDAGELAKELEVILEELRMNEDNPDRTNWKALYRTAYGVHPYGRPVIGTAETIKATTREDLLKYFASHYHAGNVILVIAGDVDPKAARPLIEKTFGTLPAGPKVVRDLPVEPPQTAMRVKTQEREAKRAYLDLGFHGPSMRDPDVFAWDLLGMILGAGETSRLYREVKEKGLVDSIGSSAWTPEDPGLLSAGGTLASASVVPALEATLFEAYRLAFEGPTGAEIARVKTALESDFLYSMESVNSQARTVGYYEVTLGDAAFELEYLRKIRAVTADDFKRVAAKHLRPENLSVAVVVPKGDGKSATEEALRAAAASAWERAKSAAAKAGTVEPKAKAVKETLENGVRVIVRTDHSIPVVSVHAGFLAGVRAEPKGKGGLSTLVGEMVTKGTKSLTARQISERVEDMAADLSGFSGRNATGLRTKFLRKDLDRVFPLFVDVFTNPTFPSDELEKKKVEVLGRLRLQKDEGSTSAILLFMSNFYGEHPYGRNPLGTEGEVKALASADLAAFWEANSDPRNLVVSVSGDIGTEEALALVRSSFGAFAQHPDYKPLGEMPVPVAKGVRKATESREKQQAHFVIGYPGARFTSPDRYELDILGSALAGMGGRLFVNLRDKKSLAYSVTSFSREQVDTGYFAFYMGTSVEKLDGAVTDTFAEIEAVRRDGITREEFDRAVKWIVGNYEIGLQSNDAYADSLMLNELYGTGFMTTFDEPEKIRAVKLERVNEVAKRLLSTTDYTMAVVGGK